LGFSPHSIFSFPMFLSFTFLPEIDHGQEKTKPTNKDCQLQVGKDPTGFFFLQVSLPQISN